MSEHYDYDVIIIGAGISGLVCGCYLAKAGLKTLIVEKNAKPGGYCTSFTREGFHFDACVHSLSSFRKDGRLNRIFEDLELNNSVKINKFSPTDIIITPEFRINISNDVEKTLLEFKNYFPHQKAQLEKFFKFVAFTPVNLLTQIRSKTLENLLDNYFNDSFLKTILSVIILGLAGSPPNQISALVSCLIYREFIFDGGYYPSGGAQALPDTLSNKFIKLRGKISYNTSVKKILTKNNTAIGIEINNKEKVYGKCIVSACDFKETFIDLIEGGKHNECFNKKISSFIPSYSAFLVYLGIDKNFNENNIDLKSTIWLINSKDIKEICSKLLDCHNIHLAITSPSTRDPGLQKKPEKSVCLTTNVPYMNKEYWNSKRGELENRLIEMASKVVKDLKKCTVLKFNSTPITLYKWTYNFKGAAYGWASTPNQFGNPEISQATTIENLYVAGHWSNQSSGVTSVVNCAYNTADMILRRIKL